MTLIVPALALSGWILFPDSTITVVALAVTVSFAVAVGLWRSTRRVRRGGSPRPRRPRAELRDTPMTANGGRVALRLVPQSICEPGDGRHPRGLNRLASSIGTQRM